MTPQIVHLMGPTGAGKSTLLRAIEYGWPQLTGTVEIGKLLRAKYGDGYFKGQAAPEHTQAEAWALYIEHVEKAIVDGKKIILVDGQPRDISQAVGCVDQDWSVDVDRRFVWVDAPEEQRLGRVTERDAGNDDALELARDRMTNDYRNCYLVFVELLRRGVPMEMVDTSSGTPDFLATVCLASWESES